MEGKEVRHGVVNSAIWATVTTAASNGSVNAMHDSFTPLGGLVPMWMMMLGEVVFGGVGSGLYGMFAFIMIAVFAAGLMVGRTPEYMGKKIGIFEMKMAVADRINPGTGSLIWYSGRPAQFIRPGRDIQCGTTGIQRSALCLFFRRQ